MGDLARIDYEGLTTNVGCRYDKDHKISYPAGSREAVEVRLLRVPALPAVADESCLQWLDDQLAFFHECWCWSNARPR